MNTLPPPLPGAPPLGSQSCTVQRVGAEAAAEAVAILHEAAAWAAARNAPVWTPDELRIDDFRVAANAEELVVGYAGSTPAATMLLQAADRVYWPEAAPGSALYVHKVAVRRAYAGQQWVDRLIEFAAADARRRKIGRLRLDTILRPALRSLYERLGFTVIPEEPLMMRGRPMIRMERVL